MHHLLGWTSLAGALVSVYPYIANGGRTLLSGDFFGPNVKPSRRMLILSLTEDALERVLIGSFALRLGLLVIIGVFSVTQLLGGDNIDPLPLPAFFLKDPLTTPAPPIKLASESSEKKESLKKFDTKAEYQANALKSVVPKILMAIRMMYPIGNRRLQLLLLLRFVLMLVQRIIRVLVPLQTERLLRVFSPESYANGSISMSKFDFGSVLLYVFYNYLQRHSNILSILYSFTETPVDSFVQSSLQLRFFEHVHSLSMQFYQDRHPHEIIDIMQVGVQSVTRVSTMILFTLLPTVCDVTVSLLYFTIVWGWKYGLLIVSNAILVYIASKLHRNMMRRHHRDMVKSGSILRSPPLETLMNAETVKYFTNESYEVARYQESIQLENPIQSLTCVAENLRMNLASMDELIATLKLEPTVNDVPDAPPLIISGGEIEFENVSFQYSPDKKGLSNISFKVLKGQTVGIVGPTGSGKSTILRLLVRFWDPSAVECSREHRSIASRPRSFYDTIGYNINYGRTTASKEEIEKAAKVAQIHDTIIKFENGYETQVGNQGAKLSGGERQRISIARTVLKNPPIVLMDEATSALDSMTESDIQQALNKMTENRTTIAVAHRLSTISHADLILYIKDGEVVERGTHEELMQRAIDNGGQGEYYKMWRIQMGKLYDDSNPTVGDSEVDTCVDSLEVSKDLYVE
ncbi:ATP-binding cassette sub- B member 6, mitochondrial [Linnemannia gamsii]|uniref:ATP-binding cassette sub- B member 6, mitochondrial n=1 Tax=Linnemannia gamsii TaxID=64522 RepID=A0A9P6UH87_9FUNG|nr:ATP-binding cassette sub- B member 6, mitochondrial [Linnemannia gamsii]